MSKAMHRSVLRADVLPFIGLFSGLILAAIGADAALHLFDLVWIGRYLGIPGTILILLSFGYSLRKRNLIRRGNPRTLLRIHETLTCLGALMVLVHAGIHFYAILPWLALLAMLVNVASGMTGRFLLSRARRHLAETVSAQEHDTPPSEVADAAFWDAVAVDAMKQWRAVHLPITLAFAGLALAHVASIFLFWQWK
jgi:hypothetical protein